MLNKDYYVLAFYIFTPIEDPEDEVRKHKEFFHSRAITSRIYISKQGINAQMSAYKTDAEEYMVWMRQDPRFASIDFKIHEYHEQVFPRATVKVRKELVALGHNADPHKGGEHLSSARWKQMLEEEDVLLLDVRNDYEWKIGHFEGAIKPPLDIFKKFPAYIQALKQTHSPQNTKVLMYCTGGIRCELYSALMKEEGFAHVYQLEGGVIKYGLQEGEDKWRGKLFVFDDRMAISIAKDKQSAPISECAHCGTASDTYYNCANMDCNELFLACPSCANKLQACCCQECMSSPKLRLYEEGVSPKPFRRKHLCTLAAEGATSALV